MRRLFGGHWKQMSDGEVKELEKQIAADMRTGTFRAVEPTIQPPTADELWQRQDDGGGGPAADRLPTMSSTTQRSTVVSQASRGQSYDEYRDDYGGYQDAYGGGGGGWGGGAASSDSGYGPGYYDHVPPRKPVKAPVYYVPSGGPFDVPEARPESVYDGGSRANSMRSTFTTRTSRTRPPTQGYYPPSSSAYGGGAEGRAYSMRSDPGRIYARSPMPRMVLRPQPSWDGRYHGGGGDRGYAYGGGDYGYRGWDGQDIEEHEYPPQGQGTHYQDYQYPER
ncbi:hypothetical protein UCDDA912_g01380 [Diaporthe ampelina]|uniref:Uncharacterized protein n=1 Tax=Diaporthe ampelina TaxID=1214573 RepID=A0A0G2HUU0_9PEZI|nr:hypothetical protein UCDDA912_g01380 [Diaporthe ampelina]